MRRYLFSSMIFLLSLISNSLYSQSKIYFLSKSQDVEFSEINFEEVSYFTDKGENLSKEISKVVIVFNAKGAFLVPSKLDFNDKTTKDLIVSFVSNKIESPSIDQVYKDDHTIISSNVTKQDKEYITLEDNTVLQKKKVVAIVYKNGHHEIFGPVERAAEIMWLATDNQKKYIAKAKAKADADAKAKADADAKAKADADADAKVAAAKKEQETNNSITKSTQQDASINPSDSLSQLIKEDFKRKADYKIRQFTNFVYTIINDDDTEKKNKAIEECVSLFVKNSTIEVASLNTPVQAYTVRAYLNRLKLLPYTKIEIRWTNVSYVSNIHLDADGKYSGTIIFEQTFKGYVDQVAVYSDVTQKKATVILETFKKFENGKTETSLDVYLSNIAVDQVRENK